MLNSICCYQQFCFSLISQHRSNTNLSIFFYYNGSNTTYCILLNSPCRMGSIKLVFEVRYRVGSTRNLVEYVAGVIVAYNDSVDRHE
jgi:hypothetical protein